MSTYTPIAYTTTTSSASSVILSNIPQTYTDLVLVLNFSLSGNNEVKWKFNSDTGTNYSRTYVDGGTTSPASGRQSNVSGYDSLGRTTQMIQLVSFNNYSNTTTYKTVIHRYSAGGSSVVGMQVGLWRSTSAISTIEISLSAGTFTDGSTFNLYGIDAQASAQAKATGGHTITRDANYWYHIFNSSGTFTPTEALTADYLVVAGGGGGYVQGGGAGGMRSTVTASGGTPGTPESALSLTAQAYTVTVGAGGAAGTGGTTGSNSVFSTITSTGGGGSSGSNGVTGGSGGGAFNSGTAGSGTDNQGYAGGAAPTANAGGGGGGAGATGSAASGSTGGNGGNGVATSITGSSVTYAGGGSGYGTGSSGTAGAGGGGTGGSSTNKNGTANTGGGAGGFNAGNGGTGGSGIVIIRYAV